MAEEPQAKKKKVEEDLDGAEVDTKDVDTSKRDLIKKKFLVDMPQDFYDFWDIIHEMNPDHPADVLKPYELW